LAYFRTSIIKKKHDSVTAKEHILVSSPVDPEFEMLVLACSINLFESLLQARFKTTVEEDLAIL